MPEATNKAAMEVQAPATITNGNGDNMLMLFDKALDRLGSENAETAVAVLEKLMDLRDRVQRDEAVKAFNIAMVEFQSQCPAIPKNRKAKIATKAGGSFGYAYSDVNQIARTVKPILTKLGISFSLDQECREGRVYVAFTLSHRDGHSRTSHFDCPEESLSAASAQQKTGIADTYAARRAMRHALGIIDDDDSDGASPEGNVDKITDEQLMSLQTLIDEVKPDMAKFLEFLEVAAIEDLPKVQYARAMSALEEKRRRRP